MSLAANIWNRITGAFGVLFNRFEAGVRYQGPDRSWIPAWVQDARFDASEATVEEIRRKSRYFEMNDSLPQRIADLFEQYVAGVRFITASTDDEWNERGQRVLDRWCKDCDISGIVDFCGMQGLAERKKFFDGEMFILLTRGEVVTKTKPGERPKPRFQPRIQAIEAHRVKTPPNLVAREGIDIIAGREIDARGRIIAFHIQEDFCGDKFTRRLASEVIHYFDPDRPGMLIGVPMMFAVLNDLHDLSDLRKLTMQKAKEAASVTSIYKTASGEFRKSSANDQRYAEASQNSTGDEVLETKTRSLQKVWGARAKAIKLNESFEQHRDDQPGVAQREHWDYLVGRVATGTGVPKILVSPSSLQGTMVRGEYETAAAFFRRRSSVLAACFERIVVWYMEWAVLNEVEASDPPADGSWRNFTCRAPRSFNVDVGRNSTALIEEYKAGWRTLEGICGEMGEDWVQTLKQRAREMARAAAIEQEFGVLPGSLIAAQLETMQHAANQTQAVPVEQP